MKTVEYRGNKYNVPWWARFIATDADGSVWAYEERPIACIHRDDQWNFDQPGLREVAELEIEECPDWRDSLVELPE
jgi:hypothetical protein